MFLPLLWCLGWNEENAKNIIVETLIRNLAENEKKRTYASDNKKENHYFVHIMRNKILNYSDWKMK